LGAVCGLEKRDLVARVLEENVGADMLGPGVLTATAEAAAAESPALAPFFD
jgi:hypothetical protein